MNNEKMNICEIIRRKFSDFSQFDNRNREYNNELEKIITLFLVHNTHDYELESETENSLILYNRKNKRNYIVTKKDSDGSDIERIDYLPSLGDANSYLPATEENAEAVAFSIYGGRLIMCFRVNRNGLFIEKYRFGVTYSSWERIETEYYDQDAICSILSKDEVDVDNYKNLIELLDKLGVTDGRKDLRAKFQMGINPDQKIEGFVNYKDKFCIECKKDGITVDYLEIDKNILRPFYTEYIYCMRDQGFYQDNNNGLRFRT